MKQAIVIRMDLKISKGKAISQACHACLGAYKKSRFINKKVWEIQGQKKVILKVKNEKELLGVYTKAKEEKLPVSLIRDMGKTQIKKGSITCIGIGPAKDKKIDKATGSLKLF